MGENGSGKTTLVKLLTGELDPQDGLRRAHRQACIMMSVDKISVHVTDYFVIL